MPNPTKQALFEQFARVGKAVASAPRLEILDLLAQGEKTVETLADQAGLSVKNVSAHLRTLRAASLVETRKDGTYVHYRLADPAVHDLLRCLQDIAARQLAEVRELVRDFFRDPEGLEPLSPEELAKRLERGEVTVLDVRPEDEFRSGHIPGALSLPLSRLRTELERVPTGLEVVAYCRGPYCVLAVEAAELLRRHGVRARRLQVGLPDWERGGLPVEVGA
ncbi:MAG: metalloregulator ArsR/SmtB family transcription factor [Longimicrobiales bacterium]|nr:metalloregulator ArsR/SmtB family transcription factor [Longimicrobiales bacterium]